MHDLLQKLSVAEKSELPNLAAHGYRISFLKKFGEPAETRPLTNRD
jgi:hypothetical protein